MLAGASRYPEGGFAGRAGYISVGSEFFKSSYKFLYTRCGFVVEIEKFCILVAAAGYIFRKGAHKREYRENKSEKIYYLRSYKDIYRSKYYPDDKQSRVELVLSAVSSVHKLF